MENVGREIILDEFSRRKSTNSVYSLRALARDLGINRTTLSDVIASKRTLSKKNALKLADKLNLSPVNAKTLVEASKPSDALKDDSYLRLQEDTFRLMSDWYYLAILNLAKVITNKADTNWIADRLNITEIEAKSAMERLVRLDFIRIVDGSMKRTVRSIQTTRDIPSSAIRNFHKQTFRLAEYSLENDTVDKRANIATTMAIDPQKIEEAKVLITKCQRKISKLLTTDEPSEVYTFACHLFPLSRKVKKK